ncbi:LysR substrate-binding domain-containing protein, partial [Cronobacter turicensis]
TRLSSPLRWALTGPDNAPAEFDITRLPAIAADSAGALMTFALEGCGVALLPEWLVADALARGTLVRLLPAYRFPAQGVYAVYPDARHVSGKVRGFIDFLRARAAGEP